MEESEKGKWCGGSEKKIMQYKGVKGAWGRKIIKARVERGKPGEK